MSNVCPTNTCRAVCCSFVPFDRRFWKKNKKLIPAGIHIKKLPAPDGMVIYAREDAGEKEGCCPFLNSDYRCIVYDNRPEICRLFGSHRQKHPLLHCYYLGQGDPRVSNKKVDEVINRISGGKHE